MVCLFIKLFMKGKGEKMLIKKKSTTIEGRSVVDDVEIAGFRASIDSDNPDDMTISVWQSNKSAYKTNRESARADQAEFEDYAYTVQDELKAEIQ